MQVGEPIEAVWIPEDCVTSTIVNTPEGATIEVGLMGMEGLVGLSLLLGQESSNTTVIVQIPGHAMRMSAADFKRQVVEPRGEAYVKFLRYVDAFLALVAQTAACNSLHNIEERLARWILLTQDRVQRPEMPLTHEFLSYMLGVRRASVSMAAAQLAQKGLIHYTRGSIRILDRERLEGHACTCYTIVREITDRIFSTEAA